VQAQDFVVSIIYEPTSPWIVLLLKPIKFRLILLFKFALEDTVGY